MTPAQQVHNVRLNAHQVGEANRNFRHGLASHTHRNPTYRAWSNMLTRTTNKNFHAYEAYENVKVCDRWLIFENFLADMGEKPSSVHTLSRHLDSGDYEPGNVEWATWGEQKAEHYGKVAATKLHKFHEQKVLQALYARMGYPAEGSDAY